MPFYKWHGIDIVGNDHKGVLFARTADTLEAALFDDGIALLGVQSVRNSFFGRSYSVSYAVLADFCSEMANLLHADIPLDTALAIAGKTIRNDLMKSIAMDCVQCVKQGELLSTAFSYHKDYLNDVLIFVVEAGQESGHLAQAFDALAAYYQGQKELFEKLRTSLLVPGVTFVFLFGIMLAIFMLVIPRFKSLFSLFNNTLPATTRFLFSASSAMQTADFWLTLTVFVGLILIFVRLLKSKRFRSLKDRIVLALPLIGTITSSYSLTLFLQTLSFLLKADVHLIKAMQTARNVIGNVALVESVDQMIAMVESGKALSTSFEASLSKYEVVQDIESLFVIGEITGGLSQSVERVASLYQQKTYQLLSLISRVIPMILLILLGLFIAVLMIALYLPLLSFAKVIA